MGMLDRLMGRETGCPHCGSAVPAGTAYCGNCGEGQPGGTLRCPECNAAVSAIDRFCPKCRRALRPDAAPAMAGNLWRKEPGDFAARIQVDDVPGLFKRELVVEAGTRAVLLVDGRNEHGEMGPGRYTLQSAGLSGTSRATAILVDNGAVDLDFTVPDLFTRDPLRVTAQLVLAVRVKNAVAFLTNLMKGRRVYPVAELRQYLFDEVQGALAEEVSRHGIDDLSGGLAFIDRATTALEAHLRRSLERVGIDLEQLRSLRFSHEDWAALGRKREELVLETARVALAEQRLQVLERMHRAALSERASELKNDAELLTLLREQDAQRLIKDDELDALRREIREAGEDHDLQRRFAVRGLEMQKQLELDKLSLIGEGERLELRLKLREAELRGQLADERIAAVERKKIETEVALVDIVGRRDQAKTAAEIAAIEMEELRLKFDLGQQALEAMRLGRHREKERELELELKREDAALEREIRRRRTEQEVEAARLKAMTDASITAQIAVAGAEQAALLADLQRTEALKGLSPDAILALAAERSPEVARALAERARGGDAQAFQERIFAMYDRMLEHKDAASRQTVDAQRDAMAMLKELAERALDTQRDTAAAAARGGGAAGAGALAGTGPAPDGSPGAARVAICRRCGQEAPVGTKYCRHCGERFFSEVGDA